jgi:hypothetical protein
MGGRKPPEHSVEPPEPPEEETFSDTKAGGGTAGPAFMTVARVSPEFEG